jgi:hypothetical protein
MKRLDNLDLKQQADAEFTEDTFTSRFAGPWIPPEHRDLSIGVSSPKRRGGNWLGFTLAFQHG